MVKKNERVKSEEMNNVSPNNFTLIENLMLNDGIDNNLNERSQTNQDYWEQKGSDLTQN